MLRVARSWPRRPVDPRGAGQLSIAVPAPPRVAQGRGTKKSNRALTEALRTLTIGSLASDLSIPHRGAVMATATDSIGRRMLNKGPPRSTSLRPDLRNSSVAAKGVMGTGVGPVPFPAYPAELGFP